MLKASQNNTVGAFVLIIALLVFGYSQYGANETMTSEVSAQEPLGLAGEADWLASQKAELEKLAKDVDQIGRAVPEQLAQVQADTLDSNLTALQTQAEATFSAAVALKLLGDPEYDVIFRDLNSAERLEMSDKLIKVSADLDVEANRTKVELMAIRAKIPSGGPTPMPEPPVIDVAATQQDLRRMFEELGVEFPKN